jgi:hypothetical protein
MGGIFSQVTDCTCNAVNLNSWDRENTNLKYDIIQYSLSLQLTLSLGDRDAGQSHSHEDPSHSASCTETVSCFSSFLKYLPRGISVNIYSSIPQWNAEKHAAYPVVKLLPSLVWKIPRKRSYVSTNQHNDISRDTIMLTVATVGIWSFKWKLKYPQIWDFPERFKFIMLIASVMLYRP